jgi:hypothetical protein
MLNLNALENPYSSTRPKLFFSKRKDALTFQMRHSAGGKILNASWKPKDIITKRLSMNYNANIHELKVILPWALILTLALITLLIAL